MNYPIHSVSNFLTRLILVLAFFAAGCGGADTPADPPETPEAAEDSAGATSAASQARVEDGVQVIEIEAGPLGFQPNRVDLQAGVPARLIFTRTIESECSEQVQIPNFGIEKTDLPLNEPVAIEFTPPENGRFTFVCGMDMQQGTIAVEA